MAIVNMVITDDFIKNRSRYISWPNLANGDTGEPIPIAGHSDKTLHVFGTFGSGGVVLFEGSNDPRVTTDPGSAVWSPLKDLQGMDLSSSSAEVNMVIENPRFIRPRVTAGDGTTSITSVICARIIN